MKQLFKPLFIILIVMHLIACKKPNNEQSNIQINKTYLDYGSYATASINNQNDGYITYSAYTVTNNTGASNQIYLASAYFYKTNPPSNYDRHEVVGDVNIGGLSMLAAVGPAYKFNSTQVANTLNAAQFGSNVNFSITGNGVNFPAAGTTFYVPDEIWLDSANICNLYHSINDPLQLNWNADPNNSEVAIILTYDGFSSSNRNPSLNDKSYAIAPIVVSDNGSYNIPASYFNSFPIGSTIEIFIGRSALGNFVAGNKQIDVLAYAYSSKVIYLIQ